MTKKCYFWYFYKIKIYRFFIAKNKKEKVPECEKIEFLDIGNVKTDIRGERTAIHYFIFKVKCQKISFQAKWKNVRNGPKSKMLQAKCQIFLKLKWILWHFYALVWYIDVGDGCWKRNVLVTILRCWWRFCPFRSPTSSIS